MGNWPFDPKDGFDTDPSENRDLRIGKVGLVLLFLFLLAAKWFTN